MHVSVFVDRSLNAVDPSETEGLLYRVIIGKVWFSSVLFQKDKPYLGLRGVILLEPDSPLLTVSGCISHRACRVLFNLWEEYPSAKLTIDRIQPLFLALTKMRGGQFCVIDNGFQFGF